MNVQVSEDSDIEHRMKEKIERRGKVMPKKRI